MAQYVPLPDGSYVTVQEGETPAAAWQRAQKQYPEAFESLKPKAAPESGFMPALKAGAVELGGGLSALAGKLGIKDLEKAQAEYEAAKKRAGEIYKPTEAGWTEAPLTKFGELLGGSLPYMAAPVVAGGAAAALPLTGAAATVAGLGAAGLASAGQFTATNLARQMEEGKKLEDTDVGAAALAAIPQAALDTLSLRMIPGIGRMFGQAGVKITAETAKDIAEQGLKKTLADYTLKTGKTAGVEGLTESAQQVFERLQAGLSLTDEKARQEYFDNFIGGAILGGTLSVPGRFIERGREQREARGVLQEQENAKRAAEQKAEEERKKDPNYILGVAQEYEALEAQKKQLQSQIVRGTKDAPLDEAAKQANKAISEQLATLASDLRDKAKEFNSLGGKNAVAKIREQQRVEGLTPEQYALEQAGEKAPDLTPPAAPVDTSFVDLAQPAAPVPAVPPLQAYLQQQVNLAAQFGPADDPAHLASYLMQDPAMAQRLVETKMAIPGVDKKTSNAILGGLKLQLDQQAKQAQAATAEQLQQQQTDLAAQQPAAETDPLALWKASVEQTEDQATEELLRPNLETLRPSGPATVAVAPSITPVQNPQVLLDRINSLIAARDQAAAAADNAFGAGNKELGVNKSQEREAAQTALNQLEQAEGPQRAILTLRKAQDTALMNAAQLADDLRVGRTLGGPEAGTASSTPQTLVNQINKQRDAFVTAAVQEAATTRRFFGKALTQEEAEAAAKQMRDVFNEWVTRSMAQPAKAVNWVDRMLAQTQAEKAVAGKDLRDAPWVQTMKQDFIRAQMTEALTKRLGRQRMEEIAKGTAELKGAETELPVDTRRAIQSKASVDFDRLLQTAQKKALAQSTDPRPLEERRFGAYRAATQVLQEQLQGIAAKLKEVPRAPQRVESQLKMQFGEDEANKVAEARGETATTLEGALRRRRDYVSNLIDRALQTRANLPDAIVQGLQRARDAVQTGLGGRDVLTAVGPEGKAGPAPFVAGLLDSAEQLAQRVLQGRTTTVTGGVQGAREQKGYDALTYQRDQLNRLYQQQQQVVDAGVNAAGRRFTPKQKSAVEERLQSLETQLQNLNKRLAGAQRPTVATVNVTQGAVTVEDAKLLREIDDALRLSPIKEQAPRERLTSTERSELQQQGFDFGTPVETKITGPVSETLRREIEEEGQQWQRKGLEEPKTGRMPSKQPTLFPAEKSMSLSFERTTAQKFANAPIVKRARAAAARAKELLSDIKTAWQEADEAKEKVRTHKIEKAESAVAAQRADYENAFNAALEKAKVAEITAKFQPQIDAVINQLALLGKERAKALRAKDAEAAADFQTIIDVEREELQNLRQQLEAALKSPSKAVEPAEMPRGATSQLRGFTQSYELTAAADDWVQFEKAQLAKAEAKLAKLKGPEKQAQGRIVDEQRKAITAAETATRQGLARVQEGLGLPGVRVERQTQTAAIAALEERIPNIKDSGKKAKALMRLAALKAASGKKEVGAPDASVVEALRRQLRETAESQELSPADKKERLRSLNAQLNALEAKRGESIRASTTSAAERAALVREEAEASRQAKEETQAEIEQRILDLGAELADKEGQLARAKTDASKAKLQSEVEDIQKELQLAEAELDTKALTRTEKRREHKRRSSMFSGRGVGPEKEMLSSIAQKIENEKPLTAYEKSIWEKRNEPKKKLTAAGKKVLTAASEALRSEREEDVELPGTFEFGPEDKLFSRGPTEEPSTTANVRTELNKAFTDLDRVKIYDSVDALIKDNPQYEGQIPADARGFVDTAGNKAFLIAENINKGDALAVLLHEVGAHIGLKNMLGEAQYNALVKAVETWAKKNDGSIESRVAKAALERVEAAKTPASQKTDETLAYAIEEAVKAGVKPMETKGPIGQWLGRIAQAFRKALEKFGLPPKALDAQALVDMAFGAAKMEMAPAVPQMSRRQFLRGAGAALGAMKLPPLSKDMQLDALKAAWNASRKAYGTWVKGLGGAVKTAKLQDLVDDFNDGFSLAEKANTRALRQWLELEEVDGLPDYDIQLDSLLSGKDGVAIVADLQQALQAQGKALIDAVQKQAKEKGLPEVGELLFSKAPTYSKDMEDVGRITDKAIATPKTFLEKVKPNLLGLGFRTQFIDKLAPIEQVARGMADAVKASQMMYYLRMYDQRMNFTSEAVGYGAPQLVKKTRKDGREEWVIEATKGANIKDIVKLLATKEVKQAAGSADAANRLFTMYLAAKRADRVGLNALNFSGDITQADLDSVVNKVEGNAALNKAFKEARDLYNQYNKDLIAFAVQTGAINKELGKKLMADNDYIPYYRAREGNAELLIGGETPIRIGNLKDSPHLQELIGGTEKVLNFLDSSVLNTSMLLDMSLRNIATKNSMYELGELGLVTKPKQASKAGTPTGAVTFKQDGVDYYVLPKEDKLSEIGIPADLMVKGLQGIPTMFPAFMRVMGIPSRFLRRAVVANPVYMARQLFRDSTAAYMMSGSDALPVLGALKQIGKESAFTHRGVTGGQVFTGMPEDMSRLLREMQEGRPGWSKALSKLEAMSMEADALTRRSQYDSYIKQGLSEMEATLMALESMNFSKRGLSPSVHMATTLIPFMNAQIQSLDVMYKAFSGKMPFNDRLALRERMLTTGLMLASMSLAYAAAMQDDDTYKNATPDQKYGNWFVKVPGVEQAVRVPIPFELGYIFKALPEALYNTMATKHGGEEAFEAFKHIAQQLVPGGSSFGIPQAVKPLIEVGLGKSFYTGRDIESAQEQAQMPGTRYRDNTSELAKLVGQATNFSPIKIEALINGYTGSMGLALMQSLNVLLPQTGPEKAAKRLSDMPVVGTLFQPEDAGGIIDATYKALQDATQAHASYKSLIDRGEYGKAQALIQGKMDEMSLNALAGKFKQQMGDLTKAEKAIRASNASPDEKRKSLDAIRQIKIGIAASVRTVVDKTKSPATQP
jgi:hypothetical protein